MTPPPRRHRPATRAETVHDVGLVTYLLAGAVLNADPAQTPARAADLLSEALDNLAEALDVIQASANQS